MNARLTPPPELGVDGDFGPATRAALVRYQRSKGLRPSGIADAKTWVLLQLPADEPYSSALRAFETIGAAGVATIRLSASYTEP